MKPVPDLIRCTSICLALGLIGMSAGCGQKGPLFLPAKASALATAATPAAAPSIPSTNPVSQ